MTRRCNSQESQPTSNDHVVGGVEKAGRSHLGLSTTSQLESCACNNNGATNKLRVGAPKETSLQQQQQQQQPMQRKQPPLKRNLSGSQTDPQPMSGYQQHLPIKQTREGFHLSLPAGGPHCLQIIVASVEFAQKWLSQPRIRRKPKNLRMPMILAGTHWLAGGGLQTTSFNASSL